MRTAATLAALILSAILVAGADPAPRPPGVSVAGVTVGKPGRWTADRLKADFVGEVKEITYTAHGKRHTSHAVPLLSILRAAGVPTSVTMDPKADPRTKNRLLRLCVVAASDDGYAVTFSLAELTPDAGGRPVWVAFDADGQPLSGRDAPVKLVVPDDEKPGRWVHGVTSVTVVDPTTAATTTPATRPAA